jgi:hypothetical protein
MIFFLFPIVLLDAAAIDLAKKLDLPENQIGDTGAEKLAGGRPLNHTHRDATALRN